MAFTANSKYLVSGGLEGVQVWQVKDGEQVTTMRVGYVYCVAVSKDGRFIAAGTIGGDVLVLDGMTYEQVFTDKILGRLIIDVIYDVNFLPDSIQLMCANEGNTATIWDIAACRKVQTLDHGSQVLVAKYSPEGDRIMTTSDGSV